MFFGESTHSMDAKNRVFVPKRFQTQLPLDGDGARAVVLTRGLDGCLFLFSEEGFAAALARLERRLLLIPVILPPPSPDAQVEARARPKVGPGPPVC